MTPQRSLGALVIALVLPQCSLTGLDDFALAACVTNAECEPLNVRRGFGADACQRFVCETSTHQCALRAADRDGDGEASLACGGGDCDDSNARVHGGRNAVAEICDGLDNDCDAIIDEGALAGVGDVSLGMASDALGRFSVAAGPGDQVAVVSIPRDSARSATAWLVEGAAAGTPRTLGYATHAVANGAALRPGCWVSRAGVESLEPCDSGAVTLASAGDAWFAVGINRLGCPKGQVRVGLESFDATVAALTQRGPAALSNAYLGIDVDAGQCSGGSRAAGAPHGVTAVAIAASGGGADRVALAAWLGDDFELHSCASPAVPVEALGLWREQGLYRAANVAWTSATADGAPLRLGLSRATTAPAIVAWEGHGFVAAYPGESGRPVLQFVPGFAGPPAYDAVRASDAPSAVRATAALRALDAVSVPGASVADGVVLAALPTAGGLSLGMAWQEGCGAATALWFARATVDASGRIAPEAPQRIVNGTGLRAPSIVAVARGFVRPEFARAGAMPVGATTGGWLLAWTQGTAGIFARRVLAADGLPLEEASALIEDAASLVGVVARGAGGSAARLVALDGRGMLHVRDMVCATP